MDIDFIIAKSLCSSILGEGFGIIDAGSHEGDFTEFLLGGKSYERAIMIEPLPEKFSILTSKFKEAKLFNCALSNEEKDSHMFVTVNFPKCSSLYDRPAYDEVEDLHTRNKIDVKIRRIESLLDEANLEESKIESWYFKIDTEGFEIETFLGLGKYTKSKKIAAGHFEYGGTWKERGLKITDMMRIMEEAGFVVFKCEIQGQNATLFHKFPQDDDYEYANFYFIRKEIAIKYKLIED